jgi:hypothetical protein
MGWGRSVWVVGGIFSLYQSLAQSWPTLKDL